MTKASILTRWDITLEELTRVVDENPSLRGMILGYLAELKLEAMWLSGDPVEAVARHDDHDRRHKGDRVIRYRGEEFVFESKSLQTATVKSAGRRYVGRAQVDASDRRTITLPDGRQMTTTCLLRGEFDILAVNVFAFQNRWRFLFAVIPEFRVLVDDLDMGQVLPVGADLVLTLHDQRSPRLQDSPGFPPAIHIEIQHRRVPPAPIAFRRLVARRIVVPKRAVRAGASLRGPVLPEEALHVRRIEDHGVQGIRSVGKVAAIDTGGDVRRAERVPAGVHMFPEHTLSEGHIRDPRPGRHMKIEDLRKDLGVRSDMGRHHKVGRGQTAWAAAA